MADISKQIDEMMEAYIGSEMRKPIADALSILNAQGRQTETLNNKTSDYFAKQSDMGSLLPMDTAPKNKSKKLVTSGGIFSVIGDMDDFDWGSDDWLT